MRTGLDAIGTRVVILSSIIQQILANGTPQFFAPGLIAADLLLPISNICRADAQVATSFLQQDIAPLTVSVDFELAKQQLIHWDGTPVEDQLRQAALDVSWFSTQELHTAFHPISLLRPVVIDELKKLTQAEMPFRPTPSFEFVDLAVNWIIPLLSDYRNQMSLPYFAMSNPLRDLLLVLPEVQNWHPDRGQLVISAQTIATAPRELRTMLTALSKKRRLVQQFRGSQRSYRFFTHELIEILTPRTAG